MDTPVARLIYLRHGESANVINQQAGALPGAPLTAHGPRWHVQWPAKER